jgi:hypothetical protein
MNVVPEDEERPLSWRAVIPETPVISSNDQEVGTVHEVLGWDQEDIFHGIVVRLGAPGEDRLIPAERLTEITNHRLVVSLTGQEVRELSPRESQENASGPVNVLGRYLNIESSE